MLDPKTSMFRSLCPTMNIFLILLNLAEVIEENSSDSHDKMHVCFP